MLDAPPGEEVEPGDDEYDRANGCGVLNQWPRLREAPNRHEQQAAICKACPRNNGELPPVTGLYVAATELLTDLDMGLNVRRDDVTAEVLEAARIVKYECEAIRAEDRRNGGQHHRADHPRSGSPQPR